MKNVNGVVANSYFTTCDEAAIGMESIIKSLILFNWQIR